MNQIVQLHSKRVDVEKIDDLSTDELLDCLKRYGELFLMYQTSGWSAVVTLNTNLESAEFKVRTGNRFPTHRDALLTLLNNTVKAVNAVSSKA